MSDSLRTVTSVVDNPQQTTQMLATKWAEAGIRAGNTVLLHSNVVRTIRTMRKSGHRGVTADTLLASFRTALGPEGTLVLPVFNFDFTQGAPFVIRHTPSQMGALTEAGRLSPGTIRTGHPIYSFAALGRHADRFCAVDNRSGYGPDSPFAILRELDGTIAVLDLPDQDSMTFYHHVEEMENVPYRYHKTFQGSYTDWSGLTDTREYSLFVRNLELGVETHVWPMEEHLWRTGLYHGDRPGEGSGLRTVHARSLYDAVVEVIRDGKASEFLYKVRRADG